MKRIIFLVLIGLIVQNTYGSVFYVDPVNGDNSTGNGSITNPYKTLDFIFSNNLIESKSYVTPYDSSAPQLIIKNPGAPIKVGDTIMLYSGLHGDITIKNYINDNFITIKAVSGETPILRKLHLQAAKKWIFEEISISSEPYGDYINDKLVFLESHNWQGPVSDIEIKNCDIFSTENPWSTINDWNTKVSDGISISNCDNITLLSNTIRNVHLGVSLRGNNIDVLTNEISNFCIDGLRVLGSNQLIEGNTIKNAYKTVASNHEDAIQSFTIGGIIANNNIIRKNILINYEDPNQLFIAQMQGIGCFDGPFDNWVVENNLIFVDDWNGITLGGANNAKVVNNTVLDPTPLTGTVTEARIMIRDDNASNPSTNCIVKNNIVNGFHFDDINSVILSNNVELPATSDYVANFVDFNNRDFHLLDNSVLIDAADDSEAPDTDIEGVLRPQGTSSDIGCYEYLFPLSIPESNKIALKIFPNPLSNKLNITGKINNVNIRIYNLMGEKIISENNLDIPLQISLHSLSAGIYILNVTDNESQNGNTYKIIKK